ncbi:hypothetical protein BH20ACI2_BH20ACI2_13030 [soil metagenome]
MVVGIASILFLELGFTTFISTTDLAEKSSAIVTNADIIITPLPVEANGIANTFYFEDRVPPSNPDYSTPKKQDAVRTRPLLALAKVRSKAVARPDLNAKRLKPTYPAPTAPAPTKPNDPSEDIARQRSTIASARKGIEVPGETRDTPAPVIVKQRSEKRSFIASALPIIKKPYSWIKAIGSKMF